MIRRLQLDGSPTSAECLTGTEFRDVVAAARSRHLLSSIISRHTDLRSRGPRELVGLCCFHAERTPSLEVNDSKGTYYCHGCGKGGDALTFLVEREGFRFRDAVQWLLGDELPVISIEERAKRKAEDEQATAERIKLARSIAARVVDPAGTPAEVYARSRGIVAPLPPSVGFVMTSRWRNYETGELGRDHPAMACVAVDAAGEISGVQCVFLQDGGRGKYERIRPDGTKAKAKLSFGVIAGSAVRLGAPSDHVILVEGPEDGLSLMQELPGQTVWVACGTAMMSRVVLPPEVRRVTLAGDNNVPGQKAVVLATARLREAGIATSQIFPDPAFKDWNDQLRGVRS